MFCVTTSDIASYLKLAATGILKEQRSPRQAQPGFRSQREGFDRTGDCLGRDLPVTPGSSSLGCRMCSLDHICKPSHNQMNAFSPITNYWSTICCACANPQDEYDDFYKQLAGAYVANDLDLFMTLLRAAAKSLKAFNRHFVHLDIKAANFVVEKRASADQPVKVRLVDLGGALAIGQPLRPRHK